MKPPPAKTCPACGERYEGDVLFCPRDGTPLANTRSASFQTAEGDPYVGVELAGHIRIKHLIGIGSMGRVYRAFQAGIERDVAVKILHRELSGNGELVARFHREAKVASRLVHPNVVQVLMTGTVPFRADPRVGGEMYLVMEHLDGISLLSALAAAGNTGDTAALPLPRALHIVLQLCDAVGEAHAQGIVHRDLKPENVMLIRRGEDPDYAKVLDFGIARIDWANHSMATQAGLIFGTAKYISPEGAAGEGVGPPADVYSIATILYQCLAGRAPFEDESPVALLVQHTHATPPELRSIPRASYVPAPIAEVVMQNLAKKPSARAQDARAFGRELVAAMRASGLDPEEIIAHSTLIVRGAVRLASHARTKSMDMTPELATVIAQASKAPPLPAPPPPPAAGQSAARTPVPTPAILVGVRPTDTMVVDASELIDVSPPPLPVPPPGAVQEAPGDVARRPAIAPAQGQEAPSEPAQSEVVQGEVTWTGAAPGELASSEAASGDAAESAAASSQVAESAAASSQVAESAAASSEAAESAAAPSETAESAAPADEKAAGPVETAAAGQAVAAKEPSNGQNTESVAISPAEAQVEAAPAPQVSASRPGVDPAEGSARVSAPPSSSAPVAVSLPLPPPSLRTLFDAPAPEAVTSPPAAVAEAGLLPVAPERPGGTQVGPSPFDGDSIDTSIPPLPSRPSSPGGPPIPAPAPRAAPRPAELDWNDDAKPTPAFQSTMQGTSVESAPAPAPRQRSRVGRVIAILAIAAAAAGTALLFGKYLGDTSAAHSSDALDELVEQARECARTRSWDSPPGANVRDITARALEQAPGDKRILEIRKESAEKIVTEALGRKYAGNRDDAQRLAKVALDLDPTLTTAQHLVAEIEAEQQAESAAASASASASAAAEAQTSAPVASAKGAPPKPSAKPPLPAASALPPSKGTPSAVAPAKTTKPSTPPPKNTGGPAVLPQPTSTGPWL